MQAGQPDYSQYPPSYAGNPRYEARYDKFTPAQKYEAWKASGQLPPVNFQGISNAAAASVDAPQMQPQMAPQQPAFQIPSNPYPPISPYHRQFRELEAMGDAAAIQQLLQQYPPQPTGLFGM